jgi:hypothetical protein
MKTSDPRKGNFVRRKTDYLWMLVILVIMIAAGEYFFPERSTPQDMVAFRKLYDVF